MGKTKTKTTSNETATTTPNIYGPAQGPIQNYYSGIADLQKLPSSSVTGTTNLNQRQAEFDAQYNLGKTDAGYNQARGLLDSAVGATAGAQGGTLSKALAPTGLNTTNVANVNGPAVAQAGLSYLPTAAQATDTSGLAGKDVAQFGGATAYGGIKQYLDPQLDGYVKASLDNFDDTAGRTTAAYAANGALNKAFGGSRFGIGEAQLGADLTRGRALTESELRSDAYKTALGAAQSDASNANSAGIASMQAQNQRDETLGSLSSQLGMFNAGQTNDNNQSIFDALNQMGLFNAGAQNTANNAKFGVDAQAAQQNASEANTNSRLGYTTMADLNQFNAGQANNMSQFNSNFALDKAAQIGGMGTNLASILGQQGDSQRANIGLQAQLGDSQYAREQQQALAPYTQQQIIADLLNGGGLLGATTGQTINSNGTSTSKESGGLLKSLLSGGFGLGAAALGKK